MTDIQNLEDDGLAVDQRIDFKATSNDMYAANEAEYEEEEVREEKEEVSGQRSVYDDLSQEDPMHHRHVSRSLTDSGSMSSRKGVMYRREYQRHRTHSISSDSAYDEDNYTNAGRKRHRRKKM